MSSRDVEPDLPAGWPRPVANMIYPERHTRLTLRRTLQLSLLLEHVARELGLQIRAELEPAQAAIFGGHRLHEQVGRSVRVCPHGLRVPPGRYRGEAHEEKRVHHQ